MKNKTKRIAKLIFSLILVIVLQITLFSDGIFRQSRADEEVKVEIFSKPKVDIVLAKSRTLTNVDSFEKDIKEELQNVNVSTEDVQVKAIDAQTVDLKNSFSWEQDLDRTIGNITIGSSGKDVTFVGNHDKPGKNAMWIIPEGNQEQEFNFSYNINFGDSFNAAGMLLRVKKIGSNQLTGYMLSFNNPSRSEYQGNSGKNGALWTFNYDGNNNSNMTKTFVKEVKISTSGQLKVSASDTQIKVSGTGYTGGDSEFVYNIPEDQTQNIGNGYGFFSDHYSHGCDNFGEFKLQNINLKSATVKSFKEVLSQPDWRNNAYKILVYIEDYENQELSSSQTALSELITRLLNENIYYVGWGNSKNQNQMQEIVENNNKNGKFINNTNSAESMKQTAEYIKSILDLQNYTNTILIDEPLSMKVTPEGIDTNSKDDKWTQGKWKVEHDYKYYEHNMGQFSQAGIYTNDMIKKFDKTGKYKITYQDQSINPEYLYVHRRPVAEMNMTVSDNSVDLESTSYDLDEYSNNDGIDEVEWKYKTMDSSSWTNQKLTTIDPAKTYIIQLRAKDHQGAWSYPVTKYITKDTSALPVAMFNLKSDTITKYEKLEVKDSSYDPAGGTISKYEWELWKDGSKKETTTQPITDFRNREIGEYRIYLTVTNNSNKKSERFSRKFTVTNDETPPEVLAEPMNCDWKQNETVHLQFTDAGGSLFRGFKYAITDSQETPAQWESEIPQAEDDISITQEGNKYLHIQGWDNDNNASGDRVLGIYHIDHSEPTVQIVGDFENITTNPISITINSSDSLSGVKEVRVDGHKLEGTETTQYQIDKNGTYSLEVEDVAGNIHEENIVVNNIYQECTAGLEHPVYSTSLDSCPICDLIEGLEVTKETEIYNSREQKVTYSNPQDATIVEYYNASKTKPVEVGTYNYDLKVEYEGHEYNTGRTGVFTVTPKDITIEDIVAKDREYNGTKIVELEGGHLVGVEDSDLQDVNFVLPSTGTIPNKNVGKYNVTIEEITLEGTKAKNYNLIQPTPEEVQVEITKKRAITPGGGGDPSYPAAGNVRVIGITATDRQYNATTDVEIHRGTLVGIEEIDKDKVDYEMALIGTADSKDVGQRNVAIPEIVLTGEEASNYEITQPAADEVKVEITQKDITIEGITATNREYNGTDVVEVKGGALVGIEEIDKGKVTFNLPQTGNTLNKNVGHYNVIISEITLEGEEAKNYKLAHPAEDAVQVDITPKQTTTQDPTDPTFGGVRVKGITATSRVYNGKTEVELNRGTLVGIEEVDKDKVDYELSTTGTSESKDVGIHNVAIPEIVLTGEEAKNYTVTQPEPDEVKVEITQKDITIEEVTAVNREYNATKIVQIQGGKLVGVEEIDKGKVGFNLPETGTIPNKNVGKYNVTIPEITLTGEEAKNYRLIQPAEDAIKVEITKKKSIVPGQDPGQNPGQDPSDPSEGGVRVKGITATNRVYNGKTEVEINRGTLVGIEEVDKNKVDYKMSTIGTIDSKDVGIHNVTIPEIELTGEEAENYEITQPSEGEVKVEITPKEITITGITATDREYNGTKIVELKGGELIDVEEIDNGKVEFILPKTGEIDNKDIGEYDVSISEIKLKGEEAKNYKLIQPLKEDVHVTITKRKITVGKLKGKTKNYDGSDIVEIEGGELQYIVEGEDVKAIIPKTGKAESRHTGKWKVSIADITLEGEDIDNYELIQPNMDDILVEIKRSPQPKLHIEPFVSDVNEEPADNVQAKVVNKKVRYKNISSKEKIRYGDIIKITIRVFNEGYGGGYVQKVKNYIPEGLKYLEDSEINEEYGWKQKKEGVVETEIFNFESGDKSIIKGITENKVDYIDIDLELEVTQKKWVKQNLEDRTVIETFDIEGKDAIKEDKKDNSDKNSSDDKDVDVPKYEDEEPEDLEKDGWRKKKGDGTNGIEKDKDIWTTDPTDPTNPDKWVDPTNPDYKKDENTKLYPVYEKEVTVTRNIYLNTHPADDPLKGYACRSVDKNYIVPAEINLGTTSSVEIDGYNAVPRFWSISNGLDIEDEEINGNEGKAIPLNGTVKLTEDETYNMSYKYKAKIPYIKPDGTKGEAEQDVNVSSDGEKKTGETKIPGDDNKVPEDLEKEGWEKEKGTGKEEPGNGIEEGKDVWTTDPTDPSNPDNWVDPTDPEFNVDPKTPIYPVYKKEITVTRNIYLNSHPADDPLSGIAYRSVEDSSVIPAKINLGTAKNINTEGKVGTPKKWVTGYDEDVQEVELDGIASLTQDEEYYMIYTYTVKIQVPDENGDLQDENIEIEVKPDGEKELAPDESGKRELKLPENTKKPDENTNWTLEGWTKGDDITEEVIDPTTEIPEDGDEYHPKWSRQLLVERYVYPNTAKLEPDLTKKIYGNDIEIEPVEVNLETAPSVQINGKEAEPRLWSTLTKPYIEDTTANNSDKTINEETVALNGVAHLTKDTKYYMSYKYVDSHEFTKPGGSKGTIYEEVYVNTNGEEERKGMENPEEEIPEDLKEEGWEKEKGTGKEEPGNGIQEGRDVWTTDPEDPSNLENWVDPTDPDFKVDPETPIYPVYKKEVTVTRNIYLNTHPKDDPLKGIAYRSTSEESIVPAEFNLGTTNETSIGEKQATPKKWVTGYDESAQEVELEGTVSLIQDQEYYMIYTYNVKVKVQDEGGELQEQEVEVETKPDGGKQLPKSEEGKNKGIELPEEAKKPDDDYEWKLEGWTKGNDPSKEIIDPETEIPEENDEYYPKWSREIIVERYIHPNTTKMEPNLIEKVYGNDKKILPAQVNLGTTDEITIEEQTATPKKWVTDIENPDEGTAPNGIVSLTENEQYYMIYSYTVKIKVPNSTGEIEEKHVEVEVKPDGERKVVPEGRLHLPEDTKKPDDSHEWTLEGWTKGNDPTQDAINPETEIPKEGDEYHPKWSRDIKVERYIYPDVTKMDPDITKKVYGNEIKIIPVEVNLGTTQDINVDGNEATPKKWVTDMNNPDEGIKPNGIVSLTENEEYYMIYSYNTKATVPDESGGKQEKDIEIEVKPNGEKDVVPGGGLELPENPKKPDEKHDWKLEGWTKGDDPTQEVIDPETEMPGKDDEYHAKWTAQIKVERYVHPNTTKVEPDLTKTIYGNDVRIVPAEFDLGTTTEIDLDGQTGTPKKWVTDIESPDEGIEPNGTVSLTEDEQYYMIYSYTVKVKVEDENGDLQEKDIEVEVKPDGEKEVVTEGKLNLPENAKEPDDEHDWILEGWTKGDDPTQETIDPETEIPKEGDEYHPKWSRNIIIERYIYPDTTRMQPDLTEKVYGNKKKIVPAQVNLGTTTEIDVDEQTGIPKKWVTDIENPEEGIEPNGTVSLTENEQYYMIYSYKTKIKIPDENGDLQDKEVEVEVKPDGRKEVVPKGGLELPENPKKPDEDHEWTLEGWTKGDDPTQEIIDPETEVPGKDDEYHPKWSTQITVERYIYPDTTKMESDITKTVYGNEIKIIPVEVELGTTENITIDQENVKPRFWSTSTAPDTEDTTANNSESTINETAVKLNGKAHLTESKKYYMSYTYTPTYRYNDGTGEKTLQKELKVSSDGTTVGNEFDIPDPSVLEGWTTFIGWTKGDTDPDGDLIDKETEKLDKNTVYHAVFTKEVTLTYDKNFEGNVNDIPEVQTGTVYKNDLKEVSAKITISQQRPTREKRKFAGWSNIAGTAMGTDYTGGEEVEINENKTIYAVWNTYELGDPETYGDYVNYDVDVNGDNDYSNDWMVYHYDGEYIYLILEDYLPATKLPEAVTDTMRTNGDYYFGWQTLPRTNLSNIGSVFMDKYLTKFNKNNSTNYNVLFLSDLLDTSNWEGFKGKFGEEVIASPTIELLTESYKRRNPDDPYSQVELTANDGGYLFNGTNKTTINTIKDKLYAITNMSKCSYYWISSPAPTDSSTKYKYPGIYRMEAFGSISELSLLDDNNRGYNGGLRPVIRLKSGVTGKQKEDNTWDLIEAPFNAPKINLNTKDWSQQVMVTIEHDSSADAVTEYSLTGKEGDWQTYSQGFTVNQEGKTVYARTTKGGTTLVSTLHITNVDVTPPTILSMELEESTIKTNIRDEKSGIAGIKNKLEGTRPAEYDWQDLTKENGGKIYNDVTYSWLNYWNDGTYTLYAKDLVGNISHLTKSFSNVDNDQPRIIGNITFIPGGKVSCPNCGQETGMVTITADAADDTSGLAHYQTGVWSVGKVTDAQTGQQTSTTHVIYDQSPEAGAKTGRYVERRYFHNLQAGHTYTATFVVQDLYGNKVEVKSQEITF